MRELIGGIYFGENRRDDDTASDLCVYTVAEAERIMRIATRLAQGRKKKLTSVDKADVLETSRLWREVTVRVMRAEFPDVALAHMLVDARAMHLLRRPADVIRTRTGGQEVQGDSPSSPRAAKLVGDRVAVLRRMQGW